MQNNLGVLYESGRGVERSYEGPVRLYRLSANQIYLEAMYNLGRKYENGYGVKKSYEEAAERYELAAEQGNEQAMSSTGPR